VSLNNPQPQNGLETHLSQYPHPRTQKITVTERPVTLEEIADDPQKAWALQAGVIRVLAAKALAALNALNGPQLALAVHDAEGGSRPEHDRLLHVDEGAQRLGVKRGWIYRNQQKLPFVVRQGRLLRCSNRGIDEYIRKRLSLRNAR
jgi:predicted DNA-binding transcriptional regulator AlpA